VVKSEEVESEIMQVWWFGLDGNGMCGDAQCVKKKIKVIN
jgi:hypothetical protein